MPRFSSQSNDANSIINGLNTLDATTLLSQTTNEFFSENAGFTSSTNLLFRHRLAKPGRTFSVNLGVGYDDRTGDSDLLSTNIFYDTDDPDELLDQRTDNTQDGLTLSSNFVYTEPIGRGQLQVNYRPSVSRSQADRVANLLDPTTGTYSLLDPSLSNTFDNSTRTERGGLTYRLRNGRQSMLSVGFQAQDVQLTGDQTFPTTFEVNRSFQRVLPNAMAVGNASWGLTRHCWSKCLVGRPKCAGMSESAHGTDHLISLFIASLRPFTFQMPWMLSVRVSRLCSHSRAIRSRISSNRV